IDPNASRFDRILVMPQLAAVAPAAATGSPRVAVPPPSMGLQPSTLLPTGEARGRPWSAAGMPGAFGADAADENDGAAGSDGTPVADPNEAPDAVPGRFPSIRSDQSPWAAGTAATPGMVTPIPVDPRRPQGGGTPAFPSQPPRLLLPTKPPGQS
ncbi:MAG: hypothetical protein WCI74_20500, partial [Actinomycetes bacterium]